MPREIHMLTPSIVAAAKASRLADGGGLYLQVGHGGNRSWCFRYNFAGKPHWMGLGAVDMGNLAESLAAARQKAQEARDRLAAGQDPLEARRASAASLATSKAITFEACAGEFMAAHSPDWKNPKHRQQWRNTLSTYAYPTIGKLAVSTVAIEHVKTILAPMWRTKAETARRVRGRIEAVLDYATASGYRAGENPARQKLIAKVLGKGRPRVKHHAALPYKQVPDVMGKLAKRDDVPACALAWLILTATRSTEGRYAQWSEVDKDKAVWTIPAARMKSGELHRVPLTPAALAVLDKLKRTTSPYIFVAQGEDAVSDTSLRDILREFGYSNADATLHGFRSSFRDWAAESGVADDIAEAALAHTVKDKTVAAYKRTRYFDARADVMLGWDLYLGY
jgi:integrase